MTEFLHLKLLGKETQQIFQMTSYLNVKKKQGLTKLASLIKVAKQLQLLSASIRHPSLHAKKYDEKECLWQARINRSWRFYFLIRKDVYRIIEMKAHPK